MYHLQSLPHWGDFFISLIDHILEFYTSLPHRDPDPDTDTEYQKRVGGEPSNQCFPNWEIKYERLLYQADKAKEEEEWSTEMCTKIFSSTAKNTPEVQDTRYKIQDVYLGPQKLP